MNFKEYVELREGKINDLRINRKEAPVTSYLASDDAANSDEDKQDYHVHLARIARSFLKSIPQWRQPGNGWLQYALDNLYKAMTIIASFDQTDHDFELKELIKYIDNANADFGNSESKDKRIEKAIHWGLIVADRLSKMKGNRRWYSTNDEEDYSPEKSPSSVRVPF